MPSHIGDFLKRRAPALGLAVLAAVVAFSYGFTPIGDEDDVWWHLKAGKIIADAGGMPPKHDVFAYTSSQIEWPNHEWLSQWGMFALYRLFDARDLGGLRAVILAKSFILVAAFLLVLRLATLRAGDITTATGATLIGISISRFTINARPPVISYCFAALFLLLLYGAYWRYDRIASRWIRLGILPVIMALWVNLHGGFVIGLILVSLFAAGSAVDGVLIWLREGRRQRLWDLPAMSMARGFALCALACAIATSINPYGFKIYGMFERVMGDTQLVQSITEMRAPDLAFARSFEIVILALIVVGSLAGRRLPATVDYLILLFFLDEGLQHVRHLPFVAVTVTPILAWQARGVFDALEPAWRRYWRPAMAAVAVCLAFYFVFSRPKSGEPRRIASNWSLSHGNAYEPEGYPERACDFLLAHNYPGRIFNEVYFAGYLIWRLSPEKYQVFTDSRFDVFGGKYQRMAQTIEDGVEKKDDQPGWHELLDSWDINIIIVDNYKQLNLRLQDSREWTRVYWRKPLNDPSVDWWVWIRNEPRNVRKIDG